MDALLVVDSISKVHGPVIALDKVSFSVFGGEILGLIGPNGAGKTTLLECLSGLIPCDGGHVLWRGSILPPHRRKEQMFYLPDGVKPYGDQSVEAVLDFFCSAFAVQDKDRKKTVQDLSLDSVLRKRIDALSKGYLRRVMLSICLLAPQPVLILDEPFDGFDLRQTRMVMTLLRPLVAAGKTLLLSVHQLTDAERICDRFVLLSEGQVRGIGSLEELRKQATLPHGALEEVFLELT
jgi:ABC-2 type transport system ATP-binding protein